MASIILKLHSVCIRHLKVRKRRSWSQATSLNVAAELLAVECGLKPCFLYDYSAVSACQIQSYLTELQHMGFLKEHLHVLNISDNVLIINVARTILHFNTLLQSEDLHVIDVSSSLGHPVMLAPCNVLEIQSQITQILNHLTSYKNEPPRTVSVGDIGSPEWNLCTTFGFLLHFPAVYWFDTSNGFENCLSMTPLRHYTIRAACPTVGLAKAQIYSFSVPESVSGPLQKHLLEWAEKLRQMFLGQHNFSDLDITVDTVILKAVTL
uniref:Chromosome 1 open reading frame 74 n=1 Tax=Leptobrachium leishanense TaxID=445787 RepID=A0A8C5LX87_9ANUR